MTTNRVFKDPMTLPAFERIISAPSGFLFCGIIDDPVVRESGKLMKLNSVETHRMISSASLDKFTDRMAIFDNVSRSISLDDTASIEFDIGLLKPSNFAEYSLSIG